MSGWKVLAADVVETRYGSLLGYGLLLTANRADAEDLVQDALVKVFSRFRPIPNVAAADQYVRRAMRTLYLDGTRRTAIWRRLRGVVASEESVAGPAASVAVAADVEAALATLSPRERARVVLRYFDDLTVPQIAGEMGLAEGTVKRYLSDAVGRLGLELGPAVETTDVVARPRAGRN